MKRSNMKQFSRCVAGLALLVCLWPTACVQPEGRILGSAEQMDKEKARRKRRARRTRDDGAPKVGELGPNFKLKSLDGTSEAELASFRGQQPVVVFFGSYT